MNAAVSRSERSERSPDEGGENRELLGEVPEWLNGAVSKTVVGV